MNGLRNGMACSIAMVGISLLCSDSKWHYLSYCLLITAFFIHRSTALPSLSAIFALYYLKDPRKAIYFWIASIFISLLAGNLISSLFTSIGFDDRLDRYLSIDEEGVVTELSNSIATGGTGVANGFRFDFLLYSAMPVLFTWYLTVKRSFKDKVFNIIAVTYILANAFWIMVIRAEFSNRFAYLSWFLYPIVIAYPLIRFNVWDAQDKKAALILLLYSGFTAFMSFVYYA